MRCFHFKLQIMRCFSPSFSSHFLLGVTWPRHCSRVPKKVRRSDHLFLHSRIQPTLYFRSTCTPVSIHQKGVITSPFQNTTLTPVTPKSDHLTSIPLNQNTTCPHSFNSTKREEWSPHHSRIQPTLHFRSTCPPVSTHQKGGVITFSSTPLNQNTTHPATSTTTTMATHPTLTPSPFFHFDFIPNRRGNHHSIFRQPHIIEKSISICFFSKSGKRKSPTFFISGCSRKKRVSEKVQSGENLFPVLKSRFVKTFPCNQWLQCHKVFYSGMAILLWKKDIAIVEKKNCNCWRNDFTHI